MKKLFAIIAIMFSSLSLGAVETEDVEIKDALAFWTDFIVRKDFTNWHVAGLVEYCTIDTGTGMVNNEVLFRPVIGYKPLKWLSLQTQVDFLYSWFSQWYLRYLSDVTFSTKASDFRFAFRARIQLTHKLSTGKVSPMMRTRAKVDYHIPKSPVSLHIAAEPYWLTQFVKTRYYLGADFKISDTITLTTDYIRYQHYLPGAPDQNVAYLIMTINI